MFTLSSTVIYAFLFACSPKQPVVQATPESVPEPLETPSAEETPAEDTPANVPVGPVMGSLEKSVVDATVKEALPEIKTCYQEALSEHPELTGRVIVKIVIGKDGTVSSAALKPEKTTLDSDPVIECVLEKVKFIEFPPPKGGGIVIITYPFSFAQ